MADNIKKYYTVVLATEGMDKVQAQTEALNKAAKAFDGTVEKLGQSLNANSGVVRSSFKVMASDATTLKTVVDEINKALLAQGGMAKLSADKSRIKTDLSSVKETPAVKPVAASWWDTIEKETTAKRIKHEKEELASQKRIAADRVRLHAEALRENERRDKQALVAREAYIRAQISAQAQSLNKYSSFSKASSLYGENSAQAAIAQAAIKESQIRAALQAQVGKIQSQYAAGNFGDRALGNRLGKAFTEAKAQIDLVNTSLVAHRKELKSAGDEHSSFAARVVESIGIYRLFNATLNTVIAGIQSIPRIGIALEQSTATLQATFGSYGQAAQQLQFLNSEAERTGLALNELRKSYATFSASALLAGQSAASVQKIFQDVNTTSTTLHLTTEQVNGVYLALSQMFNKGKVQAEELTKQLSQTLPGITNQAAAALGKSAAQLGEEMKKGLISADDAVQKMMARMAEAFGGEAFKRASNNLNAELGRLSTAWTHTAENLYKGSERAMTGAVKMATAFLESASDITKNSYDMERAFATISRAIETALLIGVAAAIVKFQAMRREMALGTEAGMKFQNWANSVKTFGIFVVLDILIAKLMSTKDAADDATDAANKLLRAKIAADKGPIESAKNRVMNEPEIQKLSGQLQNKLNQQTVYSNLVGINKPAYLMFLGVKDEAELDAQTKILATTLQKKKEELFKQFTADAPQATYKAYQPADLMEKELQAQVDKLSGKEKAIAQARLAASRELSDLKVERERVWAEIQKGTLSQDDWLKATDDLNKIDDLIKGVETKSTSAGEKISKSGVGAALRASFKDASEAVQESRNDIQAALGDLETAYTNSGISIAEYFAKQRELYQKDFALQREALQTNLARAQAGKDVDQAATFNLQLTKLAGEESKKLASLKTQEAKAYLSLADVIREVNYEYQRSLGGAGETASARFAKENIDRINLLMKEYGSSATPEATRLAAGDALAQLGATGRNLDAVEKATAAYNKFGFAKDLLAEKEERVQNALRAGAISELTALAQTDAARKQAITVMQQWIDVQAKALEGQPEDSAAVIQLRKARLELETLENQSNLFGQKFQRIFTDNFANGFREFRTGAASAKEAFQTFATGVINNIADIAAQEAATGIFNLIKSGYSSAAGDKTGSFLSSLFAASAKGNAYSGTSGHANTILSQPTIFPGAQVIPFAKGGVLAGEAGKEVVMPLERTASGKLGVLGTSGSGDTCIYNISVPVTVHGSPSNTETDILGGKLARAIMRQIVREEIISSKRPGNARAVY